MTDKELHKLKRSQLIEIMNLLSEENERLKVENKQLTEQLNNNEIEIQKAGSIAEAAMKITEIFETAQKKANAFLENNNKNTN